MSHHVRIWHLPCDPGVEMIQVSGLLGATPAQVSPAHKLVYFEQGTRRFHYRRQRLSAEAGQLLLIRPDEVHSADTPTGPPVALRILSLSLPSVSRDSEPRLADPAIIHAFRRLHRVPEAFASALEQQTALAQLREAVSSPTDCFPVRPAAPHSELGPIHRVKQYLDEQYAEDVTLAHLSRIARLDPSYLCRAFAGAVGMPPHAYLVAVRVARARELLRRGCPAGQAALEVGFYDQAHMTRHFTRTVLMPPARYACQVNFVQDGRRAWGHTSWRATRPEQEGS